MDRSGNRGRRRHSPMQSQVRSSLVWLILAVLALHSFVGSAASQEADQSKATRTVAVDHGVQDPAVSPDGASIAVSIFGKVWLIPIVGGEARQITFGVGWDTHPAWSRDGQFLAYAHQMPSGTSLMIQNLATGGESSVYHTPFAIRQIAYHPKGGEIFFLLNRSQYDSHLWRVSTNGEAPKQITFTDNWHEWSFSLSPDGSHVALDSGRYGGSNLYYVRFDGVQVRRLTRTSAHQSSVTLSPDGKTIIYVESDNGIDTVTALPLDGGTARGIFSSSYDQKQLALYPDGTKAALCAGRRLYSLNLKSGQISQIPFVARFTLPALSKPDLTITNAAVFEGTGSRVIPNATIEIRGGRITRIDSDRKSIDPPGIPVLDAGGKVILPGLMDNHYHFWNPFSGASLLMQGITSVRDPGSAISTSLNYKEAIALGIISGPDLYTCGPLIDGLGGYHPMVDVELSKPEAARQLVQSLKSQGVDALKVYFLLPPDVLRAVVQEAHRQDLRVTGHLGVRTGWREAMSHGIDGFNHVRIWKDFLPLDKQPQGENETLDSSKNFLARMQADWSEIDVDSPNVKDLLKIMVDKKIGFDPTLSIQRISFSQRQRLGLEQFSLAEDSYFRMAKFVALANSIGVPLLAGTDNGSLFDEMEAYAEVGISPVEILRAASINGAVWLGKGNRFGTIEVGKQANLIIVDGDPLKDIRDMRKISVVIKDGRIVYRK
jgi:WD40 repeat protein